MCALRVAFPKERIPNLSTTLPRLSVREGFHVVRICVLAFSTSRARSIYVSLLIASSNRVSLGALPVALISPLIARRMAEEEGR